MLNTWKVLWVVLADDAIEFYKKKTDRNPKGMIPLKGAALINPCQDFPKKTVNKWCLKRIFLNFSWFLLLMSLMCVWQLVFKISTTKKQDHFFQATHLEERELWIKDIKRAISCLESGKRFARKSTRRSIKLPESVNLRYYPIGPIWFHSQNWRRYKICFGGHFNIMWQ